jgi:hypothetical protein
MELASDRAFLSGQVFALQLLHQIHHLGGNNVLAYKYLREFHAKNDTLQGEETRTQLARAEAQYDYQNKLDLQAKEFES